MTRDIDPIHPGEILLEEFLVPMEISQYRVAKDIGVPPIRINEVVNGKRAVTADTALRLSRYFGMSERFWMNLQVRYDLEVEKEAVARLNPGIAACVAAGDNGSRELLERILISEEEHADGLETQLSVIEAIGVENYLSQQLHDE